VERPIPPITNLILLKRLVEPVLEPILEQPGFGANAIANTTRMKFIIPLLGATAASGSTTPVIVGVLIILVVVLVLFLFREELDTVIVTTPITPPVRKEFDGFRSHLRTGHDHFNDRNV
jgi:hypothetical protein